MGRPREPVIWAHNEMPNGFRDGLLMAREGNEAFGRDGGREGVVLQEALSDHVARMVAGGTYQYFSLHPLGNEHRNHGC